MCRPHAWLELAVISMATVLAAGAAAQAGRPCQDNFTEVGERNSRAFKSFIDLSGTDAATAFQAVGREIAAEGFAAISASKDLGVVSAYQDTNGKHSPLNAVVTESKPGQVRVEVVFQLAPGLRAPSAGVKDVLCKVLEAALPPDQKAAAAALGAASGSIALRRSSGEVALSTAAGTIRQAGIPPVILLYNDYGGTHAGARTQQRTPVLLVHGADDPAKKYLLVKLDSDREDDRRSLKLMSARKLAKMAVTGKGELSPDPDWTLPFVAVQTSAGAWEIRPKSSLEPGEYGLWDVEGLGLAAFGIDP